MQIYLTETQYDKIKQRLAQERNKVDVNPTENQKEAGNYKMGHININGFDITIENPKGSYRQGKDKNGKSWKTLMHYDYGYFKHTLGKDGDAIDVFIGPYLNSDKIFCVDQFLNGKFDETKVMLGFKDKESAKKGYLKNYEKDWKGFKEITEVSVDNFKKWLYDGYKQRKPFYQYYDVKHFYITESQYNFIQNKLQESEFSDLENNNQPWWKKCIEKYQKNGKIKLYHNTRKEYLDEILSSEEIENNRPHTEGHGDVIFFTCNPDAWGNECKISIEVPVDEFGTGYNDFYFVNTQDVTYTKNISIYSYNFKIEKVDGLTYDEIFDKIKNDDEYIWAYLTYDRKTKQNNINTAIGNWFYDKVFPFESDEPLNESQFIDDTWMEDTSAYDILNEFVSNPQGKIQWGPLINPSMYQTALNEFTKTGKIERFPSKYIYQWIGIILRNTLKLIACTELHGHASSCPLNDIENSSLFEFIEEKYNLHFIDFESDNCIFETNKNALIYLLKTEYGNKLTYDEEEILDNIQNNELIKEDGVHQYGPLKGQTAMFLSQKEIDKYDYNKKIKDLVDSYEGLIEIYNKYFQTEYNEDQYAYVTKEGKLMVSISIFNVLYLIGFYDWAQMPDGTDAISDYGPKPILNILNEYNDDSTPEQTLVIVNKALDVYHQRGDLCSIFIQGGRETLNQISNGQYINENKK